MKYAAIHQYREQYRISMMCRALGVSRSGFYAWCNRPECLRAQRVGTNTVAQLMLRAGTALAGKILATEIM